MSIRGLVGFNGLSVAYDNIESLGSSSWDWTTDVPNVSTSRSVRTTGIAEGRIPWQGAGAADFWIHAHMYRTNNSNNNDGFKFGWTNGSTELGWIQLQDFTLNPQIVVDGTVEATGASPLMPIASWGTLIVHVQLVNGPGGQIDVYADGDLTSPVVSFTGNTDPGGLGTANKFYLRLPQNDARIANLVAMVTTDATGRVDEQLLTNIGIKGLEPDADGFYTAWTPDTGGTGYTQIDEAPPVDTDYVEATAVGQRATFSHASVGTAPVLLAAKWFGRITRQGSSAGVNMAVTRRLSAVDYDESTVAAPGDGYVFDLWDEKPGGGDWTSTDLDNTEFGVLSVT